MKSEEKYKISFEELSRKGKEILTQQPETSYADALAQVQLLKATSQVTQSSKKGKTTS